MLWSASLNKIDEKKDEMNKLKKKFIYLKMYLVLLLVGFSQVPCTTTHDSTQ